MAKETATRVMCVLITALIMIVMAVSAFGFRSIDRVDESKLDKGVYNEHKAQQVIQEQVDREKFDKIDTKLDKILDKI